MKPCCFLLWISALMKEFSWKEIGKNFILRICCISHDSNNWGHHTIYITWYMQLKKLLKSFFESDFVHTEYNKLYPVFLEDFGCILQERKKSTNNLTMWENIGTYFPTECNELIKSYEGSVTSPTVSKWQLWQLITTVHVRLECQWANIYLHVTTFLAFYCIYRYFTSRIKSTT